MDTEEVDLGSGECAGSVSSRSDCARHGDSSLPASDPNVNLDTGNESDKFTSLGHTDTNVPIWGIARCRQSPDQVSEHHLIGYFDL